MTERWRLERAGIINVFQYGDETIHFGGGRLLLRGVNGSGKSTAMNMLLPFLLDADVRRIDAAGEQTGVLRSWMLSGREETQPTGYLWLEMRRGDDHLAFGCGIRANRNTDSVNHWWFMTERRPGIDLALVSRAGGAGRVPLSAEQLRAEIGAESVWAKEQRAGYREALRTRLYGGADLEQHLRLLHIVRNPRVGDRVDVDLPDHLHDALPQLSETSIDDAATPLEQLEEHRRNVAQLTGTVKTLDALVGTYRLHARSELRERAGHAIERVRGHRELERRVRDASRAHEEARAEAERIEAGIGERSAAEEVHRGEIDALHKSPAYRSATQLDDKRAEVERLRGDAEEAAAELERVAGERAGAAGEVAEAGRSTEAAGGAFDEAVAVLRSAAVTASIGFEPSARPEVRTVPARAPWVEPDGSQASADVRGGDGDAGPEDDRFEGSEPDESGPGDEEADEVGGVVPEVDDGVLVPVGPLEDAAVRTGLGEVRAVAQRRGDEIAEVQEAIHGADRAANELAEAERRRARAEADHGESQRVEAEAGENLRGISDVFLRATIEWDERLGAHLDTVAPAVGSDRPHLPHPPPGVDPAGVAEASDRLVGERRLVIDRVRSSHSRRVASIEARLEGERLVEAQARELVEDLAARTFPDPPSVPWQGDRDGPSLAELVDFDVDLADADRCGVEAALEASGLLAAEVRADGLVAGGGELLVTPGVAVGRSLADLLRPVVTDEPEPVDHLLPVLTEVLRSVSVDPADLERIDGPPSVIATSGHFRIGSLTGRHSKDVAEHIGVTARREALERQRADAAEAAREAEAAVARSEAEHARAEEWLAEADRLAADLPSTIGIVQASTGLELARDGVDRAAARLDSAVDEVAAADRVHARRVDLVRRRAAELSLPHDPESLRAAADSCRLVPAHVDGVTAALSTLSTAVEGWRRSGRRWAEVVSRWRDAGERRRRCDSRHRRAFAELATLEDQIGLDASQVLAAIEEAEASLRRAVTDLDALRRRQGPANERVGVTRSEAATLTAELERSEEGCRAALDRLRETVRVPGLLEAALDEAASDEAASDEADPPDEPDSGERPDEKLPIVPHSSTGLHTFARALLDRVPEAPATPADSVRIALRQRRADLGAGWDARDLQPDPTLPLSVEVMGPLGTMALASAAVRADSELRTASALLSSQQDDALRNLLQGLIADEVAMKMHAAEELVDAMNSRLVSVRTAHGVGVGLRWVRRDDLSPETDALVDLLRDRPGLRHDHDAEARLVETLSVRIDEARRDEPDATYAALIARIFDYRNWHRMAIMIHRAKESPQRLGRRTALSEGEKKMVSYQPLFAAVAASCDALAEIAPEAPRFVLLDDAFAKVSEDNHPKLFGLLVDLDLDFIATSERLWGTHDTVPELAITEVLRDADAGVIVLEHSHWDGRIRSEGT